MMRSRPSGVSVCVLLALLQASGASAQESAPLFSGSDVIDLTLSSDFKLLEGDRRGETPERPGTLSLLRPDGSEVVMEVQLQTRGKTRRAVSVCSMPPLRINFKKKQTEGTIFDGQDKLKIVGSCRPNRDSYEQLVLVEYLAYRILRLVTNVSFQVRLVRIRYVDEGGGDEAYTRYAFFIEDDDAVAERMSAEVFILPEGKNLPATALDPVTATTLSIFEYMIGNTDWSDIAGHNVELLDRGGVALPVGFDFDYAGLVDAPYAVPDPDLRLGSVQERKYRGWCRDPVLVTAVLDRFREAEEDIIALFDLEALDGGERSRSLTYLSGFFGQIESDSRAENTFLRDCRKLR